jgi:hypothetical protein
MQKIQLSIPTPCHEDWQQMTPSEQGRFCGACQKTVVDFTNMSDNQIIAYFKEPRASVCGRLHPDQINRDITQPKKRLPWVRHFFTITLPAFLWSLKSSGQTTRIGRVAPVLNAVPSVKGDTIIASGNCWQGMNRALENEMGDVAIVRNSATKISGQVTDESGNPIAHASIAIKGARQGVMADQKGFFLLSAKELQGSKIEISAIGFYSEEITINDTSFLNVKLKTWADSGQLGGVIVVTKVRKKSEPISLIKSIIDTAFSRFSIFPNPISPNATLTLNTQKLETGTYIVSLINSGGEVVYNEQKKIEVKAQRLTLPLPSIAAGTYYVSLFNTKTAKSYSEKLVVQ